MNINLVRVGATGMGKTLAAGRDSVEAEDIAEVILDPHEESLAQTVLNHAEGNILYDRLSNIQQTIGYELLRPSTHPDSDERANENEQRAEAFVPILTRRRNQDGMAGTPLMEEWVMAAILLYLFQKVRKPLSLLPFAFLPWTAEFQLLLRDCGRKDIRHKFQQLEKLSQRALRAEIGSAARLINAVFRSRSFITRSRGGFDLGGFLQNKGKLIIERGDGVGDDTMRVIMGAIVLLVIEHAKRRPKPYPVIRIRIDEANNSGLVGEPELRGIAETRKYGLFWDFLVQNLDFPGGPDRVLQNCKRHEWFGCAFYDLARKAAIDLVAGLPANGESRAERIAQITDDILQMGPGWRWVRDPAGSRKEYVPLLVNPWPDWPGLRESKLSEKIQWIYSRPEYQIEHQPTNIVPQGSDGNGEMPSMNGGPSEISPPTSSGDDGSLAEKLKRHAKRRRGGSVSNNDEGESKPAAS